VCAYFQECTEWKEEKGEKTKERTSRNRKNLKCG
jgi:hypothetical protein